MLREDHLKEFHKIPFSQRRELLNSLKRRHEIPHKFAYLGSGANTWDDISKDSNYDLGKRELATLNSFLSSVSASLGEKFFNILHLGSGNGIEIPIIISTLGLKRIAHYVLIDISPHLPKVAKSYANKYFKNLQFLSFVHDITKPSICKILEDQGHNQTRSMLILLIGNGAILSNYCVLTYIRESMRQDDRLLITLEVYSANKEKEILEQYKLPSIIKLLAKSLALVGVFDPRPDQFEFLYNRRNSMIEVYFLTRKWVELHPNQDYPLEIPLPDRIKVFRSFRPTPEKLRKFLIKKGFKILTFQFYEKEECCGCLCTV